MMMGSCRVWILGNLGTQNFGNHGRTGYEKESDLDRRMGLLKFWMYGCMYLRTKDQEVILFINYD